jgi:putative phosphoribosyl transferase
VRRLGGPIGSILEEVAMAKQDRFRDRAHAGRRLAHELKRYAGAGDVLVLALPRGGVPVAYEVARELAAPLDVFLVRKLLVPGREELAMGAIASGEVRVLDERVLGRLGIDDESVARSAADAQQELERSERLYRADRGELRIEGRTVILVDDGVATGSTMRAACLAVAGLEPGRLVVAVPVASPAACQRLGELADEVVCLRTPEPFGTVGAWYDEYDALDDGEVRELMERARGELAAGPDVA